MAGSAPSRKARDLGGDKNYDTQEFVRELRGANITPHVAQNTTKRRSAVDERTVRHAGYAVKWKRKRVEQSFGWMKMIGMLKKEVARDREYRVAAYLHRSCLQPVSIAKPDGQNRWGYSLVSQSISSDLKRPSRSKKPRIPIPKD